MRKIIILVMILMAFAFLVATKTAASSDELIGFQVQVMPQKLRLFSSPGETIVENITILNVGVTSADVQVKTSSRLISFSTRSISTKPGQIKTLTISIAVPAEGVYHGQLTIGPSSIDIYVVSSGVALREWNEKDLPPITYRTDNFAVRDNAGVGLDYAKAVGENAQYALNTEIGYGFNPPPDPVIDIVINDLEGYEGATWFGDNLLIEINSRFWNGTYPDWQMGVTLAHEVFHCIQSSYFSPSPFLRRWIDEGTAVWAEDEVYDYANSYLRWVNGTANHSGFMDDAGHDFRYFGIGAEYKAVLYFKFLSEHSSYGGAVGRREVVKRIFESVRDMGGNDGIDAVDNALKTISPYNSFESSYKEFAIANWVNCLNNQNGNFSDDWYEEGDLYKDIGSRYVAQLTFEGENISHGVGYMDQLGARYIQIAPQSAGPLRIFFDGDLGSTGYLVTAVLVKNASVYGLNDLDLVNDYSGYPKDGDYYIYSANEYDKIALVIVRAKGSGPGGFTVTLSPVYGYLSPPFKFSDVIDSGDSSWASPYHVELRISTNPLLDPPEGEGGSTLGDDTGMTFDRGGVSSRSIEESLQVQTAEAQEEWVEVGRGRDYSTYLNTLTGEYKQTIYPGPIHTWDGERWVSYVFENKGDYYQIQHPITSARFYLDRTEFWDDNFENRVVVAESWAVERLKGDRWQGVDFSGAQISHEILSEDEVRIVRTESSALGILKVTYIFTRGSPLKITSEFTSHKKLTVRFAWGSSSISASEHRIERGALGAVNEAERDVSVSFLDDFGKPVVNFAWHEEAKDENMRIEVDVASENFLVHFGDFELSAGQAVILDPTVQIGPNADTYVDSSQPGFAYGHDVGLCTDRGGH